MKDIYRVRFALTKTIEGGISQASMRDAYLYLCDKPTGTVVIMDKDGGTHELSYAIDEYGEHLTHRGLRGTTIYDVPYYPETTKRNYSKIRYRYVYS